jgi:serine O-acetyltransferase
MKQDNDARNSGGSCSEPGPELSEVVAALCGGPDELVRSNGDGAGRLLPSRDALIDMVEMLRSVLFPGYFGVSDLTRESLRFHVGATLDRVVRIMREQMKRGFCFSAECVSPGDCSACQERADEVTGGFLRMLPEVRRLLATDVQAAYEGDPAATSPDEAIFCYPGLLAVTSQRIAHVLTGLGVPLIPRIITEHAHSLTGIDIHPGARIGERFFIDHGTGVVIGETCEIGNGVRIYQGVTLGAKSFPLDADGNPIKGIPRHPIVEDDVVIYSGATILGRVTIGKGSIIGGNVWLTDSVPPGSRISLKRN